MRILFIAMAESIHTARWINQIADQGWEIHLIPSTLDSLHPHLRGKVIYHGTPNRRVGVLKQRAINLFRYWPFHRGSGHIRRFIAKIYPYQSAQGLSGTIRKINPDFVHSLEFQHAGYQVLAARELMSQSFPPWVVSNWGSDVYLFHRLAAHEERVKQILADCDYYTSECKRDVDLAKTLGLRGTILPVLPAAGGYNVDKLHLQRQPGPTSARRIILLKGYQNWAGRGLVGLRAIELCADIIRAKNYRVLIQLAPPDVQMAAEIVAHSTGIQIECAPYADYSDVMHRFGAARIHIGLSISDGISQSLLESIVMGAFPIQSGTACANEWIEDGRSGLIVHPEDSHEVAAALRRALEDDEFVDQAVKINDETVRQRLDYKIIKEKAIALYQSLFTAKLASKESV